MNVLGRYNVYIACEREQSFTWSHEPSAQGDIQDYSALQIVQNSAKNSLFIL